jgi:pyridoxine 5-phosphate synthase
MVELGVNIDHVATLRQARRTYEPDPVWAAVESELGGADSITVHLREDRRHISDRDVELLKKTVHCKLNLEMSVAAPIVDIALSVLPDQATIVPERREEVTTEGGIDLLQNSDRIASIVQKLNAAGVVTSAFIDPDERQVAAAQQQGFDAVELHTGEYANAADGEARAEQYHRLEKAGQWARERGLWLHAGHGLNYHNVGPVARITAMRELNIGHAIVSRSVFTGLRQAVREMKRVMDQSVLASDVRWAEFDGTQDEKRGARRHR